MSYVEEKKFTCEGSLENFEVLCLFGSLLQGMIDIVNRRIKSSR